MKQIQKRLAYAGCAAIAALSAGCANDVPTSTASPQTTVGSVQLALTIEGLTVDQVALTITSTDVTPAVQRSRTLDVSDGNATVSAVESGLPAGTYGVVLTAQVVDDPETPEDEGAITCAGEVDGVAVVAGEITDVDDLVLICTRDGGEVRRAGGIRVRASTELEETGLCGDLTQELSVSPLDTSVGNSISLSVATDPSVTVTWEASAGEIAADGSSYTCPAVAGTYVLTATITAPDGCTETFEQAVGCHSPYTGSCATLPSSFIFEGSCGLRSPCHAVQNGCDWEITCRGQTFSGEGEADGFPFYYTNGDLCSATVVDGQIVGTCTDDAGEVCEFNTNADPAPTPYCEQLPDTIASVTACGQTWSACEVIQDVCNYQVRCDNGDILASSIVNGDSLRWQFTSPAGESLRCEGPIVDGAVTGTCAQVGGGVENPRTCDDFTATVPTTPAACEETLPSEGFVLEGCGLESTCIAVQRGCVWEINCGGQALRGVASATNQFEFALGDRQCTASVEDGKLQGGCTGVGDSCTLQTAEPEVDGSCLTLPDTLTARGCGFGAPTPFTVVQNGCAFQALAPSRQVTIVGTATATGLTFPGLSEGWTCSVERNEANGELWGECTRPNPDGTVSQCRDFTADQGARLVISWSE